MLIENHFHYPAMLRVANKRCVIIGGGTVAARKLQTLLNAGADVTVIAPVFCEQIQALANACTLITDSYKPKYLQNAFVVIAATNNNTVNKQITFDAPCLVNNITEPELSNFTVPSSISTGSITVSLATGGMPAFTRLLKTRLQQFVTPELADFNDFLLTQRNVVKETPTTSEARTKFWRSVLNEALLNLLMAGKTAEAKEKVLDAVNSFRTQPQNSTR